jgi:hypothetical protein
MRFVFAILLIITSTSTLSQQSFIPKHAYKVRLRTMDNTLQRGIITALDDSSVTLLWHGDAILYRYMDISRIIVFRKGTVGKLMMATVPLTVAGGLAISRNQPTLNKATRSLNNFAGVTLGFTAGLVEAGIIGRLLRKKYDVGGEHLLFQVFASRLVSSSSHGQNYK